MWWQKLKQYALPIVVACVALLLEYVVKPYSNNTTTDDYTLLLWLSVGTIFLIRTLNIFYFENYKSKHPTLFKNLIFFLIWIGVSIHSESGKDIEVASLRSETFFGEISLLTGEARSATVYALLDSLVYEIPKQAFAPQPYQ